MDRNRLKVLALGIRWPPETFIYRLLKGVASKGIDITVASVSYGKTFFTPDNNEGIKLIPLFSEKQHLIWRIFMFIRLFFSRFFKNYRKIYAFWKRTEYLKNFKKRAYFFSHGLLPVIGHNFDIIHFHWNSVAIDYLPFYELFKAPIVISCRGAQINIAPHNPKRSYIADGLSKTFEKADAVHCVSYAIMQEAHKYGLDKEKVWVIRSGIDIDFFQPPKRKKIIQKDIIQIITVGDLIWRKGYEYALLAIRRLIDKGYNIVFRIISASKSGKLSRARILFTIDDLELNRFVHLFWKMPPEDVRQMLWESDIFLLSSVSEGISNAVLEAMACGLPVVTTDCGGMREAVTNGVEGFVVPVRDAEAIAKALERLIEDTQLGQGMGQAGRERIVKDFTLQQQLEQFIQFYSAVKNRQPLL